MEQKDMPVGINPIIVNDKGEILLLRRKDKYGAGKYCLPGGRLKHFETFEECVIREVKEETGLTIKEENLEIISVSNSLIRKDKNHFVHIGILVKKYEGIPKICETEYCDDLSFFSLDNLPILFEPIIPTIELYKNHLFYDKDLNINQ